MMFLSKQSPTMVEPQKHKASSVQEDCALNESLLRSLKDNTETNDKPGGDRLELTYRCCWCHLPNFEFCKWSCGWCFHSRGETANCQCEDIPPFMDINVWQGPSTEYVQEVRQRYAAFKNADRK